MRTRFLINGSLLLVILGGLFGVGPAAAQGGVRTTPIPGALLTVKTAPDGRLAAVYEYAQYHDATDLVAGYLPVRLVDLESGAVTLLPGPTDYALDVAFSPDGATLAGCYGTGQIVLWDVASATSIKTIPSLLGLQRCAYLPDGRTLAVAYPVSNVSVFLLVDTDSGAITRTLSHPFASYGQFREILGDIQTFSPYTLAAFTVAPDGSRIVSSAMNDSRGVAHDRGAPALLYDSGETMPTTHPELPSRRMARRSST
jgi:WD40 repeat protein